MAMRVGMDLELSSNASICAIAVADFDGSLAASAADSAAEKFPKHFSTYTLVWKTKGVS